ncbi:MAG: hypothetical protein JWR02_625 [Mucilaginibacter sp.]|nr:hypothetical protein [Mucilaginibacter sp.]
MLPFNYSFITGNYQLPCRLLLEVILILMRNYKLWQRIHVLLSVTTYLALQLFLAYRLLKLSPVSLKQWLLS